MPCKSNFITDYKYSMSDKFLIRLKDSFRVEIVDKEFTNKWKWEWMEQSVVVNVNVNGR